MVQFSVSHVQTYGLEEQNKGAMDSLEPPEDADEAEMEVMLFEVKCLVLAQKM